MLSNMISKWVIRYEKHKQRDQNGVVNEIEILWLCYSLVAPRKRVFVRCNVMLGALDSDSKYC